MAAQTISGDDDDGVRRDLEALPARFAAGLREGLRDLRSTPGDAVWHQYDRKGQDVLARSRVRPMVPRWCRSRMMRGFVMGNALAAPILLVLLAAR